MAEVSARERFECPACGGAAEWSAAKQSLVCPFCGTVSPMQPGAAAEGAVKEHALVEALRAIPENARGWQTATRSVKCQSCQAISVFKPERVAQTCDFCGSPALVPYDEIKAPIRPESVTRSPSRRVFSAVMAASERPGGGVARDRVEKRSATDPAKASAQSLNA